MEILKVSAQSDASATAGALANTIRETGEAELQGIGPKAINQAVKAIAIARSYLASSGVDLVAMPSFVDVEIDGERRTALRFSILPRHQLHQPYEDGQVVEDVQAEHIPDPLESEPEPTEEETSTDEEDISPRPRSLSEAITGRPASELNASDDDEDDESEDTYTTENEEEADSDEGETDRRSPFLGRSHRSDFDTDRDVY